MGKKNKRVSRGAQQRTRYNYITGETETVAGTKAGKKRSRLPFGHPLRTHDLYGPVGVKKKKPSSVKKSKKEDE
jgi:hypothetical protein